MSSHHIIMSSCHECLGAAPGGLGAATPEDTSGGLSLTHLQNPGDPSSDLVNSRPDLVNPSLAPGGLGAATPEDTSGGSGLTHFQNLENPTSDLANPSSDLVNPACPHSHPMDFQWAPMGFLAGAIGTSLALTLAIGVPLALEGCPWGGLLVPGRKYRKATGKFSSPTLPGARNHRKQCFP